MQRPAGLLPLAFAPMTTTNDRIRLPMVLVLAAVVGACQGKSGNTSDASGAGAQTATGGVTGRAA